MNSNGYDDLAYAYENQYLGPVYASTCFINTPEFRLRHMARGTYEPWASRPLDPIPDPPRTNTPFELVRDCGNPPWERIV